MDQSPQKRPKNVVILCAVLGVAVLAVVLFLLIPKLTGSSRDSRSKNADAGNTVLSENEDADALSDAQENADIPETPKKEEEPETITATPPEESKEAPSQTQETPEAQTPAPQEQPASPPEPEGNGHIVAVDAGHQAQGNSEQEPIGPGAGETKAKVASGTSGSVSGLQEYELNLQVSLKLRDELHARGYEVIMIRETNDVNISNAERAQIANGSGAEIFLRIHANGSDDSSVNGALTMAPTSGNPYVSNIAAASQKLSGDVLDCYCAATGFKKRSVMEVDNMSGINWCTIPVTIVEMGFMSNPEDDARMADEAMQYQMAEGIADGVDQYFTE